MNTVRVHRVVSWLVGSMVHQRSEERYSEIHLNQKVIKPKSLLHQNKYLKKWFGPHCQIFDIAITFTAKICLNQIKNYGPLDFGVTVKNRAQN